MTETKDIIKLFKQFEIKFGFKAWESLKDYLYTLYRKMEDLENSRNKWKSKYMELKNETKKRRN